MAHTNTHLSDREARAVLATWRLKPIFMRPAGGTANASLVIVGARGQYILRRRNPRYADPGQLAYDHAVIHGLAKAGLPVPRIVRSPSGSRWVEHEGHIYELFEFIEGVPAEPEHPGETCEAGAMLAKLHLAAERLKPSGKKDWPRYFDPKVSLKALRETKGQMERGSPEPQGNPRDATEGSRGRACPHARKAGGPRSGGREDTPAHADGPA
ncbi:phosphotransferase, partial [bacterium]|nr:phosphotransferase [bacterium]